MGVLPQRDHLSIDHHDCHLKGELLNLDSLGGKHQVLLDMLMYIVHYVVYCTKPNGKVYLLSIMSAEILALAENNICWVPVKFFIVQNFTGAAFVTMRKLCIIKQRKHTPYIFHL